MNVTIVIVTHARPAMLRRTLASLAECTLPAAATVRTIVVENGGRREAEKIVLAAAPDLNAVWLAEGSRIKSAALNRALSECGDDLVVFFDDDVRIEPGVVAAYVEAAKEYGRGHFFGGPVAPEYETPPPEWLKRYLPDSARGWRLAEGAERVSPNLRFLGFNWAAFGSDLLDSGGFSETFGPGTEIGGGDETLLQWRMSRRGLRGVYVSEALVWHEVPASRCSPKWTIARARGGGFTAGILAEQRARDDGRRPSPVWSSLMRFRRMIGKRDVLSFLALRRTGWFCMRFSLQSCAGFIRGVKYGRQAQPLESMAWSNPQPHARQARAARLDFNST